MSEPFYLNLRPRKEDGRGRALSSRMAGGGRVRLGWGMGTLLGCTAWVMAAGDQGILALATESAGQVFAQLNAGATAEAGPRAVLAEDMAAGPAEGQGAPMAAAEEVQAIDAASALTGAEAEAIARKAIDEAPGLSAKLALRAELGVLYDENVFLSSGDAESDFILAPSVGFTWQPRQAEENNLRLRYDGTAHFFEEFDENNGVDHDADLHWAWQPGKTRLTFDGRFSRQRGVVSEARLFDDRDTSYAALEIEQELTTKLKIVAGLVWHATDYAALQSSEGYSGRVGMNYAITSKAWVGVAGTYGELSSTSFGDQAYQSALLALGYRASEKLTMSADVGLQKGTYSRELRTGRGTEQTNLVYQLKGKYKATDKTVVEAEVGLGTVASAVSNNGGAASESLNYKLYVNHEFTRRLTGRLNVSQLDQISVFADAGAFQRTEVSVGVTTKLPLKTALAMDGGYSRSAYEQSTGRDEEGWYGRISLTWSPTQRSEVSLFHKFTEIEAASARALDYETAVTGVSIKKTW